MAWTKLDDRFYSHPKILGLSHQAFRLYVLALNWSVGSLTDGEIPTAMVGMFLPNDTKAVRSRAAGELVSAGLWHENTDGWSVHDFGEYQPTSASMKEKARSKSRAGSVGNHQRWHVERGITDPTCRYCITTRSHDAIPERSQPESGANRPEPEPEPEPDTRSEVDRQAEVEGGTGGGRSSSKPPPGCTDTEWSAALELAHERIAEGYPVENVERFAGHLLRTQPDRIRQLVARNTTPPARVAELLSGVVRDMPDAASGGGQ